MKSTGDRFTKSSLMFAFLLMGFSFTVMQTLMARELPEETTLNIANIRGALTDIAVFDIGKIANGSLTLPFKWWFWLRFC